MDRNRCFKHSFFTFPSSERGVTCQAMDGSKDVSPGSIRIQKLGCDLHNPGSEDRSCSFEIGVTRARARRWTSSCFGTGSKQDRRFRMEGASMDETAAELFKRIRSKPSIRTFVSSLDQKAKLRVGDALECVCLLDENSRHGRKMDGNCANKCLLLYVARCCCKKEAGGLFQRVLWIDCQGSAQPVHLKEILMRIHLQVAMDTKTAKEWTKESLDLVRLSRCFSSREVHRCMERWCPDARLVAIQEVHEHSKMERVHVLSRDAGAPKVQEWILDRISGERNRFDASLIASSRTHVSREGRLKDLAPKSWRTRLKNRRAYLESVASKHVFEGKIECYAHRFTFESRDVEGCFVPAFETHGEIRFFGWSVATSTS